MRAIIVGNGPSLLDTPLDRLDGVVFTCNRIAKIYRNYSGWLPDYYVRTETPNDEDAQTFWDDCKLHIETGVRCVFPKWGDVLGYHDNVRYVNTCHHYKVPLRKAPHVWHMPMLCDYGTAVSFAMQVAVQELSALKEIVLVGCDLGYTGEQDHFYDSSAEKRQSPRDANNSMTWAHLVAARSCPVPIYNATIGGSLEVYPRIDVSQVLK